MSLNNSKVKKKKTIYEKKSTFIINLSLLLFGESFKIKRKRIKLIEFKEK